MFKAETLQAEEECRVLYWPDAAKVITERVVRRIVYGERPDSPTAEHIRLKQSRDKVGQVLMLENAGGKRLASVRCHRPDLLLIGIKSEGDAMLIGHPEIAI